MNKALFVKVCIGFVLCCLYTLSYQTLLNTRGNQSLLDQPNQTSSLPPALIQAAAGEFKGLVSDFIVLDIGAMVGEEVVRSRDGSFQMKKNKKNWNTINTLFETALLLDPSFAQTYTLVQGFLPWEPVNMVAESQNLLSISAKHRPWDWIPLNYMGFNEYYFNKQAGQAGKYLLQAAQVPNAPSFLPILGARLASSGGETEAAIILLKSMLHGKQDDDPGVVEMKKRMQALEGVLVLEQATANYQKQFGIFPAQLNQLIQTGFLSQLPVNPYNLEYCIDDTGHIFFDSLDCNLPHDQKQTGE